MVKYVWYKKMWKTNDCRHIYYYFLVVTQQYDTYGDQEHIIRGNSAILKCRIPSFVADFLDVIAWVDDADTVYANEGKTHGTVKHLNQVEQN